MGRRLFHLPGISVFLLSFLGLRTVGRNLSPKLSTLGEELVSYWFANGFILFR